MFNKTQYEKDVERLLEIFELYTQIPKETLYEFIKGGPASEILSFSNKICSSDLQREKLSTSFEFIRLFNNIVNSENSNSYSINTPKDAKFYFRNYFSGLNDKERFAIAFMDIDGFIMSTKLMSEGSINETPFNIREIVKESLFYNSDSIVIAHNHPSERLAASNTDIYNTNNLNDVLNQLDIRLKDHIIVGKYGAVLSFREQGHFSALDPGTSIKSENKTKSASIRNKVKNVSSKQASPQISI